MIYSLTIDLHALYRDALGTGRRIVDYRDVAPLHDDSACVTLTFQLSDCAATPLSTALLLSFSAVLSLRPDLTVEQAQDVLDRVADKHDPDLGITRETLQIVADDLFPFSNQRTEVQP